VPGDLEHCRQNQGIDDPSNLELLLDHAPPGD
jgi:hypothetical protein